jgi:rhodanese-related sulfurtransferase
MRSEREFHATAIAHAVSVPLPLMQQRIGEMVADKATSLVLYCASGARSGFGCRVLKQLSYTHAGGLYAAAESLQRQAR